MKRAFVGWLGCALVLFGCHQAPKRDDRAADRRDEPAAKTSSDAGRKIADLTPAIIAEAEKILRTNPDAPMGTEFPFEVSGRKYVARIEQHDNPDGDPARPQGPHKGITVFSTD